MAQYVGGSTALRMQTIPYDPVSFKRMRIERENQLCIYREKAGKTLFELRCDDVPVMVFLYESLMSWELKQRKDAFIRLFKPTSVEGNVIGFFPVAVQTVDAVPEYPMWSIGSDLGEDLFWANAGLLIDVIPNGTRCCVIEIRSAERICVATFGINGMDSDDEDVLDAALNLRTALRVVRQVRVEAIWQHQKVVWFIPSNRNEKKYC